MGFELLRGYAPALRSSMIFILTTTTNLDRTELGYRSCNTHTYHTQRHTTSLVNQIFYRSGHDPVALWQAETSSSRRVYIFPTQQDDYWWPVLLLVQSEGRLHGESVATRHGRDYARRYKAQPRATFLLLPEWLVS